MRKTINITLDGKEIAEVDFRKLKTLLYQWEQNVLPEGVDDPCKYMSEELGLPAFLEAPSFIQISHSLDKFVEEEGQRAGERFGGTIHSPPREDSNVSECTLGSTDPSAPHKRMFNSADELVTSALSVTKEEARAAYLSAKMTCFMLKGDALNWGLYVCERAGIPREVIKELVAEANSPETRNQQTIAGLSTRGQ